jgi:hypothetical protein
MKTSVNKKIILWMIPFFGLIVLLNSAGTCAENHITSKDLIGVWFLNAEIPWALQLSEDGTFRAAHTVLRLEKVPKDAGRFVLDGNLLTFISNEYFDGYCKGLSGSYWVELVEEGKLIFMKQKDQCADRAGFWSQPWQLVAH